LFFYEDLGIIANELIKVSDRNNRMASLQKLLHKVNKALPSCVYVPFVKGIV